MTDVKGSATPLAALTEEFAREEEVLRQGGGPAGQDRQRKWGRLPVRERLTLLFDDVESFLEVGLWAGYKMYDEWGGVPAAGVVTGVGRIHGRPAMVIANDATVKAGTFFPQTCKKVLRAQKIAFQSGLPLVYLVDSAGAFLPLQDEVFPDEDDFGRVFRNNAVFSAAGLPQIAAIMGNCVAGGAYLPVLCDKVLMTEGSQLYLAGPALVKAAIGQTVDAEELGGAHMHAEVSGTVDFYEPDDEACLKRLRSLVDMMAPAEPLPAKAEPPSRDPMDLYKIVAADGRKEYDVRDLLACVVDRDSMDEYKAEYGQTLVTTYARIAGRQIGIVANQKTRVKTKRGELQLGGVIYADSADKAARFVMDCNQTGLPIVFVQDVQGFMVGRDAEQSGIIRRGSKLLNAMANSVVPKITVIVGGSFGAGSYVMCGKAFDPTFILAWPNAKYSVMGAEQAAGTLLTIAQRAAARGEKDPTVEELQQLREKVTNAYRERMDIRYGAARGWVDAIIPPHQTRESLALALEYASGSRPENRFRTGVLQT